jgi:phosphatidylserine decarboxylase
MKLPFMPETWSIFLPVLAGGGLMLIAGNYWGNWFLIFIGVVVLTIAALILNFFRDFERSPDKGLKTNQVISPADGKVVIVKDETEKFFLKKSSVHIAIFMNPLNNHVQRAPFDGKVIKKVYHPGEFLAAYDDKADLVNEQAHLLVELKSRDKKSKVKGLMVIKQIAGLLCRRVKTTPEAGDSITRGKRIGRILLGSRVDVFMPKGFKSKVKVGDQVKAGVTVLGEF